MQRLILEFDGSVRDFQKALCLPDEDFDLLDNIFYLMDYGNNIDYHSTRYGTIKITYNGGE